MTDRQRGVFGIDLNGRGVEGEFRFVRCQEETDDSLRPAEFQSDPWRVFAGFQRMGLALKLDASIGYTKRNAAFFGTRELSFGRGESGVSALGPE